MNRFTVAKYLRLSSEDTDLKETGKPESNSIVNQRNLLDSFIAHTPDFSGASIVEFCDDGWSGKNFERPAFQRMIDETKQGKIQCILVKDMSRLGRDYLVVGNYISRVFPFLGVRFIAVNDGIDSLRPHDADSLDTSFKALIYDLYSRDLSRKVRSAKNFRAQRGEFLSPFAPFGYEKDTTDRKRLVIDPPAAAIVRRIFQMAANGLTTLQIAKTLNEETVPTPMIYKREAGCSRSIWPCVLENNFWTHNMVTKILRDERYLGKTVYGKYVRDRVGNTHVVKTCREDWIIAECTHEGIVTQEQFERAHANMRKFSTRDSQTARNHPLSRKLRCGICGHSMIRTNGKFAYYYCRTPRVTDVYNCSDEWIAEQDILDSVLKGLRIRALAAIEMSRVWEEQQRQTHKDVNAMKRSILSLKESCDRQKNQLRELYEAFALGNISKTEYLAAKADIVKQQDETNRRIASLETSLENTAPDGKLKNDFVSQFPKYAGIEELTQEIVSDVLHEIKVFSENRIEIIWNYQRDFENILADLQRG